MWKVLGLDGRQDKFSVNGYELIVMSYNYIFFMEATATLAAFFIV